MVCSYLAHFSASALQIFPLKKFFIYFFKKASLKKFFIFSQKIFFKFQETELSYVFLKVYSEPQHIQNQKHIQNPGIFRTRGICRTLLNICDGTFCKNSYLAHFLRPSSENKKNSYFFLYFGKWNFLTVTLRKLYLYFGNRNPEKIPYISANRTFLYFRER